MDRLTALVLLRWRIELRTLRRAPERLVVLFIVVPGLLVGSVLTSLLVFFGVRSVAGADPRLLGPLLSMMATAVGTFWIASPLLTGLALGETHDLSRLLHFPIPRGTLVASSLLANLAQPMVLAQVPVVLALALAVAERPSSVPLTLLGVVLSFVFILAASQVSGLLLQGVARRRRFQDLAVFLVLGLGFALSVAPVFLLMAGGARSLGRLIGRALSADVFALFPFAWGVRAAVHAGRGDLVPSAAFIAAAAGAVLASASASTVLIHRIYRGELQLEGPARRGRGPARMGFPGRVGALLDKDLRVTWREPASKAALFMGFLTPLFWLLIFSRGQGSLSGAGLLMMASLVGASSIGTNAFGLEGRGIGLLLSFPAERWRVLVGKNLGGLILRLPGFVTVLALGALLAPLAYLPATAAIMAATFLIAAGADNYVSILFPVGAARPGQNPYGGVAGGGRGLGPVVMGMLLFTATLLLASPFVFLGWLPLLLGRPWLWVGSLPLALAGAASVYGMLVAGASSLFSRREPEMIERVLGEE